MQEFDSSHGSSKRHPHAPPMRASGRKNTPRVPAHRHPNPSTCHIVTLQVPFRRVSLTNGKLFDIYDTSGPQVRQKP